MSRVKNTNYVSKAAPTPVVDEAGLIVWFESGNLVALDHDGETRWDKDLVEQFGPISARHGLGSSLAQSGRLVFVWVERQQNPYLIAVEKATGAVRWKVPGLDATSWSTPALLPVGEMHHLVLSGNGKLAGFDPATGKRLWEFKGVSGNTVPTPQPAGNGRLLLGASVGRTGAADSGAEKSNGLLDVNRLADGDFDVRFRWRTQRATSSFGSPIMHKGLAYFVNRAGVLFCLDAETGEEVYAERLAESVWATPLAVGNRIYFAGRSGTTTVVQAGREFHILAENTILGDGQQEPGNKPAALSARPTQYALAAVPGHLLIRTGQTLYCLCGAE